MKDLNRLSDLAALNMATALQLGWIDWFTYLEWCRLNLKTQENDL